MTSLQDAERLARDAAAEATALRAELAALRATMQPAYLERIVVRHGRRISFVPVDEVDWIEAADYYVQLHVSGRTHLVRTSMQEMSERLDPRRFVRVHRSAIVNVERVECVQVEGRGAHTIRLTDGSRIALSRHGRAALERTLRQTL